VLRAYWDGEGEPSVEVPIGDFFDIGHGITHNYVSAPLQMSPEDGKAFNCWWPMPYSEVAHCLDNRFHGSYSLDLEDDGPQPIGAAAYGHILLVVEGEVPPITQRPDVVVYGPPGGRAEALRHTQALPDHYLLTVLVYAAWHHPIPLGDGQGLEEL
jgi:hypothetical protein